MPRNYRIQLKCQRYSCGKNFPWDGRGGNRPEFCPECRKSGFGKNRTLTTKEKPRYRIPKAEIGYTWEKLWIHAGNINTFEFPANRRKIGAAQLQSLRGALRRGQHFDSPIVVNKIGDRMRVIDGNHRITAIKKLIEEDALYEIDVLMILYQDKDEDGEIAIFNRWNVGRPPKADDFLQQIAHRIKIVRLIQTDFPVKATVYRQTDSTYIRLLVSSYIMARKHDSFSTRSPARRNFIDAIKELDEDDYAWLKHFCKQWKLQFGEPKYTNDYWKQTMFSVGMYICLNSKQRIRDRIQRLAKAMDRNEKLRDYAKMSGSEVRKIFLGDLLEEMKSTTEMGV